jgi:NADH:ubiquinone oxidoreductase subunit 3 (subunit A)
MKPYNHDYDHIKWYEFVYMMLIIVILIFVIFYCITDITYIDREK